MRSHLSLLCFFFFNDTATTEIYTLSLHDALPICGPSAAIARGTSVRRSSWSWPRAVPPRRTRSTGSRSRGSRCRRRGTRSEEHTSELQSRLQLVCRLLLEKKNKSRVAHTPPPTAH